MVRCLTAQSGHPSVSRRSGYQRQLVSKQAHCAMRCSNVSVVLRCTLVSDFACPTTTPLVVVATAPAAAAADDDAGDADIQARWRSWRIFVVVVVDSQDIRLRVRAGRQDA